MADPVTVAAIPATGAGLLVGVGFLFLWAAREVFIIVLERWRKSTTPPATAVGNNTGSGTDKFANRPRIEEHYFFVTVDQLLSQRVAALRCGCPARTELLRDMLSDYLTTWKDTFDEFCAAEINRPGFESKGSGYAAGFSMRVSTMMLDVQTAIVEQWNRRGIPPPAIVAFRSWESKLMDTLTTHSEKIAGSAFFPTNRERLVALLTQHATFLATMLLEARFVLRRMNGTLDGLEYAHRRIEPIDGQHDEDDSTPSGGSSVHDPRRPTPSPHKPGKLRSGEWRQPTSASGKHKPIDPGGAQ